MGQEAPQTPADPSRSRSRENRLKPCPTYPSGSLVRAHNPRVAGSNPAPAISPLNDGRLQENAGYAAAEDDVEHGQFAVPAVQREEGGRGEDGGVGIDHRGFDDFDGDGGDQADHSGRHAEQEEVQARIFGDRDELAVEEDREDEGG